MRAYILFPLSLLLFSAPAAAQKQKFQIDPLELSDCLPRWDRNMAVIGSFQKLAGERAQLLKLLEYEKDKTERAIRLHQLAVNYYREYEATKKKEHLTETIKVLTKLVQDNPRYKHLDGAHLLLGDALWTAGREKDALRVLKSFIKNYPTSPEMPRTYFFFAEFYFKEQQYERAVIFFKKADSLGPSDYSYCLSHRIAYCYYKLGKTNEAIEWLNKANELRSGSRQGQVE